MTSIQVRPSNQVRKDFLDFFKSKQHTIVPSSSLMPDSPNLLFTNAGMNQFVPIFLGQTQCPYDPGRVADTQKCIRAGGKHNDLDDVGLDTYHHTFFEMLGNWSFGDYFKMEAIDWAWELIVNLWRFPANRLYATVFCPYLGEPGWEKKWKRELEQVLVLAMTSGTYIPPNANPSPFEIADQEAAMFWAKKFQSAGRDPKIHVIPGNKKDNFWMMGETGPCGPCSEIHIDLTPQGDTKGNLVNKGDARCIEIWNLVFIQFNANADGTFAPLPAKHVDTGMGFERVTSIIQGTKGLKDFANAKISNYETDIFRPIFDAIEKLSGKKYGSTLPKPGSTGDTEQEKIDIAFRVIADHIRTLSFAIADGIQPGNTDHNYVLRRILRRAVRYGRSLGFHEPFFYKLVDVLADTMGDVFPEIRDKKKHVQEVIRTEEEAFNKTLDNGLNLFEQFVELDAALREFANEASPIIARLDETLNKHFSSPSQAGGKLKADAKLYEAAVGRIDCGVGLWRVWERIVTPEERESRWLHDDLVQLTESLSNGSLNDTSESLVKNELEAAIRDIETMLKAIKSNAGRIRGSAAFLLYDTYGFPLDLTELMAREKGLTVDAAAGDVTTTTTTTTPPPPSFEELMEEQRARARAAQKKEVITLMDTADIVTEFVGYDTLECPCNVVKSISQGTSLHFFVVDKSPLYAAMGGQVGDAGLLSFQTKAGQYKIVDTIKMGHAFHLRMELLPLAFPWLNVGGEPGYLKVDLNRRKAIERHHTVTHLLHWALHEVVSKDASQKGSFVGPDKLTFDFNSAPLTPAQVADIEKLVNERILENAGVSWTEVPYADVKSRKDVMQFFGDKYGDTVRVVQIGGDVKQLNGYSMELCGGTHTRATGEIGLFRIVSESAIAAGVRRIEAIAGLEAYRKATDEIALIKALAGKVNSPIHELDKKIDSLLAHQKALEREVQIALQRNASNAASELLERIQTVNGIPFISHNLGDASGDFLQAIADALKGRFKGVVVLGGASGGAVALVATVSPEFTAGLQAGKIVQQIAPIVGGKGGGKPENARGGGKDASKLDEALAKAKTLLG